MIGKHREKIFIFKCRHAVNKISPKRICIIYIEDITWPRGDTKFIFEC